MSKIWRISPTILAILSWTYTRKTEIAKKLPISWLQKEKICQIKALPPFKWKPIDFWLVYIGDNYIIKIR
jgi:hypothetical protein